jgi:long-chain acyl-CoA synthetase
MILRPVLLHEYFEETAERLPRKPAVITADGRWTYGMIREQSARLSLSLQSCRVQKQDRVAIFLDNEAEAIVSILGALKSGAIFVVLNGALKARKLGYILKDCGAAALITDSAKAKVVEEAVRSLEKSPILIWKGEESKIPGSLTAHSLTWDATLGSSLSGQAPQGRTQGLPPSNPLDSRCIDLDLAALIYTSGSTGDPKGVMSPHSGMIAAASSIIRYLENTEEDILLNVLPLSFDYGLYQAIMALMVGATLVLERSFLYLHPVLKRIEQEQVTGFPLIPMILAMLLGLQDLKRYDFSSLRYVTNTGAALPVDHIRRFRTLLPQVKLFSMFGLTECKRVSYLPPEDLDKRPGSVGKAIPNCEVWIEDESGRVLGPGETGQLVIRGSNVMRGYWNDPELTARHFRAGRYPGEMILHSGDLFRMDAEGFLYFLGRKDDMIKCRGERVSPKEVENLICEVNGVREAAVIGLPDEIEGQAITACVVCDGRADLDEKAIRKHCNRHLEPFAVPRHIVFMKHLPRAAHGKIDRRSLAEEMRRRNE